MGSESDFNRNSSKIFNKFEFFWQKMYTYILLFLFLLLIFVSGHIWKKNLYDGGWSKERRQEYLDTKNKNIVLNEDDFNRALEYFNSREKVKDSIRGDFNDIFRTY